jgi:hypothetical protein
MLVDLAQDKVLEIESRDLDWVVTMRRPPAGIREPVRARDRRLGSPLAARHASHDNDRIWRVYDRICRTGFYAGRTNDGMLQTSVRACPWGRMMTVEQDLVRSAAGARDVIESYRQSHIAISGWSMLLREAVDSFVRISAQRPVVGHSVALAQLAQALRVAADSQLRVDEESLDHLSRDLHSIVASIRVPGIPRPEDEDWSF